MMTKACKPFEVTPLEKFFKDLAAREWRSRRARDTTSLCRGRAQASFISADGYIVTNHRVVDKAVKVQIVTDGGATLDAKVTRTKMRLTWRCSRSTVAPGLSRS